MEEARGAAGHSRALIWTGRCISAVMAIFLLMDAVSHVMMPAPVAEAFMRLGYPVGTGVGLGIVLLVCVGIYAIPRTSMLGAILLTGYLGGATAVNVRVGNPWYDVLFPVMFGVLVWAGVYLRDEQLRRLIPLRSRD
jgi:DoxX-like family